MSGPVRGKADYYAPGDWNATCYQCGMKFKASELIRHWQGYFVCRQHWEPRHPQDFVRGVQDIQTVPWSQPESDTLLGVCTVNSQSAIPGWAYPGCSLPGNTFIDPEAPI